MLSALRALPLAACFPRPPQSWLRLYPLTLHWSLSADNRLPNLSPSLSVQPLSTPAVTATRHNPAIRDFHTRLCRWGKPRKVVLVTAMRKLLLILNTVVRDQVPWQPSRVPTAGEA